MHIIRKFHRFADYNVPVFVAHSTMMQNTMTRKMAAMPLYGQKVIVNQRMMVFMFHGTDRQVIMSYLAFTMSSMMRLRSMLSLRAGVSNDVTRAVPNNTTDGKKKHSTP